MNADTATQTPHTPHPTGVAHEAHAAVVAVTLDDVLARLDRSRARLRESFAPPAPSAQGGGRRSFNPWRRARAWLRATPWGGLLDPVVGALGDGVQHWWERQAWRQSAVLLKETVSAEVLPLVRRYPIAAMLVTAAAGAAVMGSGVWRWRTVRRSASHLGRQLRHVCMGQLTNPAVQSVLLAVLVSALAPKRRAQADAAATASPPSATPAAPSPL